MKCAEIAVVEHKPSGLKRHILLLGSFLTEPTVAFYMEPRSKRNVLPYSDVQHAEGYECVLASHKCSCVLYRSTRLRPIYVQVMSFDGIKGNAMPFLILILLTWTWHFFCIFFVAPWCVQLLRHEGL